MFRRSAARSSVVVAIAFVALGCGEGAMPKEPAAPATTAAPAPVTPAAEIRYEKITKVRRAEVAERMKTGVGRFLYDGKIDLDPNPVRKNGRFHGLRLVSFRPDWDVGLRPGDVITKVNGIRIETPFDAQDALEALAKVQAVRVDYDRDGKPEVLELPIVD